MSSSIKISLIIKIKELIHYTLTYTYKYNYNECILFINLKSKEIEKIVSSILHNIQTDEDIELWKYTNTNSIKCYMPISEYKYNDDNYFKEALQTTIIMEYLEGELGFQFIPLSNKVL